MRLQPPPRVSIVMPCFNAAPLVEETIASVLGQTHADWELICIDDGSTDDTHARLITHAIADDRIRVYRTPNGGPSKARNLGAMRLARGDVIAFLDADDIWAPERLAALLERFDTDPGIGGLFSRVAFFRDDPHCPDTHSTVPHGPLTVPMLLAENAVCTMSNLALRARIARASTGFDNRLVHNEDIEWLVRLVGAGVRIEGIDQTLLSYRTSTHGLSADLEGMRAGWRKAVQTAHGIAAVSARDIARAEAVHLRYLARRALRVGRPPLDAIGLVARAVSRSPRAFFAEPRRGVATLAGALAAPFLPRRLRRRLFS